MATITQAQWKQYIARLRKINDTAAEEFKKAVMDRGGYENIDRQKLIDYAYGISTKYGEASAALSAEMYDVIAELSGVIVPEALPAETATYSEVAKTVNGIIKNVGNEDTLAQGIGRLVKMAGTDTVLSNAYRDRPKGKGSKKRHSGAQVAWIPVGDTCPFCLMLASKGWQNQTQWAANSHSEHIHANCDCTYAVRFNNDLKIDGYDPEEYKAIYDNAEGSTRKEKLNSIRRMQYQDPEVRERINAQKRAAYAEKNSDEMYRKINRTKAEDGHEIIDDRTYKKVTKDFVNKGGIIIRGEEAKRHLEAQDAYAAYITGAQVAYIRDDATVSDVLEEMRHAYQDEIKMFGDMNDEVHLKREIDAQKYLMSMKKRYKIPIEEQNLTKANLKYYEDKLEELRENDNA